MNLVFIDSPLELSIVNKNLQAGDRKIPFRLIDVIVVTQECSFSSKVIIQLCSLGKILIFIDPKKHTWAISYGVVIKSTNMKIAQYESLRDKLSIAKLFMAKKIANHANHLALHNKEIQYKESLEKVEGSSSIESLLGIEGSFAKEYFSHYFSLFDDNLCHKKRSKRPPLDPVNATLSYIYTILYNLLSTKLIIEGFELGIGYLHKPFRSHNALSSDFSELFRHRINEFVYILFNENILTVDFFQSDKGIFLNHSGRRALYQNISNFWKELEPSINKEIINFKSLLKIKEEQDETEKVYSVL